MSSKRWCFTLNNYTSEEEDAIQQIETLYLVYGREVGESGTPHLQGFLTVSPSKRLAAMRRLIPRAHWERARGTSQEAADYCKKDGDFFERGSIPSPGKRTDLHSAVETLRESGIQAVAEEHPVQFVKFSRGFRDLALALEKPYDHDDTRGIWIFGPPGSGKSHAARAFSSDIYLKAQNKWWDGYSGQSVVILDDLDSNTLGHLLKIWADKYSCTGETKGGTVHLRHTKFVVTSNYSIEELWDGDENMIEAILRRFRVARKDTVDENIDYVFS